MKNVIASIIFALFVLLSAASVIHINMLLFDELQWWGILVFFCMIILLYAIFFPVGWAINILKGGCRSGKEK